MSNTSVAYLATKKYREKHEAFGLCRVCPNIKTENSQLCKLCEIKAQERNYRTSQRRLSKGLCYHCDRPTAPGKKALCEFHAEKRKSKTIYTLKYALKTITGKSKLHYRILIPTIKLLNKSSQKFLLTCSKQERLVFESRVLTWPIVSYIVLNNNPVLKDFVSAKKIEKKVVKKYVSYQLKNSSGTESNQTGSYIPSSSQL